MPEHKFGAVVLLGPTNAGKSTLLNTLLGQKLAIVTPKPQTTRNRITGILTTPEAQVVFLDTPGVHRHGGRMNRLLLQSAWQALAGADLVVVILDAAKAATRPDGLPALAADLVKPVAQSGQPVIVAANKVDLIRDKALLLPTLKAMSEAFPEAPIVPVSALTGDGLDRLLGEILARLPEGQAMFPEDQVSTVPLRFMAAEIVREKLFLSLKEELPYSVAVEIEHWEEDERLARVHAIITCARANHKGIIIGKAGANLKRIGAESRTELEELLEKKVYLELWVKVREDWTEDPGFLQSLGLGE